MMSDFKEIPLPRGNEYEKLAKKLKKLLPRSVLLELEEILLDDVLWLTPKSKFQYELSRVLAKGK